MLPYNITCAFKSKLSFIKLEIKSKCYYYVEAWKKNRDFISNLFTWNKSIITHKSFTTCLTQKSKTSIFP